MISDRRTFYYDVHHMEKAKKIIIRSGKDPSQTGIGNRWGSVVISPTFAIRGEKQEFSGNFVL